MKTIEPWHERVMIWFAYKPAWIMVVIYILCIGGLCCLAVWHNKRVDDACARSRCPAGLTGKHVEGAGCLCVTLPLKE